MGSNNILSARRPWNGKCYHMMFLFYNDEYRYVYEKYRYMYDVYRDVDKVCA